MGYTQHSRNHGSYSIAKDTKKRAKLACQPLIMSEAEVSESDIHSQGCELSESDNDSHLDRDLEGLIASDNSDNLTEGGLANLIDFYNEQEREKDKKETTKMLKYLSRGYNKDKSDRAYVDDNGSEHSSFNGRGDSWSWDRDDMFCEKALMEYGMLFFMYSLSTYFASLLTSRPFFS